MPENHDKELSVRKLSGIKKLAVKLFRPKYYKRYKQLRAKLPERKTTLAYFLQLFKAEAALLKHPSMAHAFKPGTSFVHSGNSGDIIYSLPAMFKLSNDRAVIYLKLHTKGEYGGFHPLGNVMMNQKMADMLTPLLTYQDRVQECKTYNGEQYDYDFDEFRKYNFLLDRGSIARWYFHVYGISAPLYKPWLTAPKEDIYRDTILIARSHRYRNPGIDYTFLGSYANLLFIGVQEEYDDMKKAIPQLQWKPVKDFLEMAAIINSCRLFIGNQSFPFSLAEALKVNRLLELYYRVPNVIPEGEGANDFFYQPQFEASVKRLYDTPFC